MNPDFWTLSRKISAIWAGIMFTVAGWVDGYHGLVIVAGVLVFPIALIWIGEPLSHMRDSRLFGRSLLPPIAGPTHSAVFAILGWIMLGLFTVLFWQRLGAD